jgi:hypothetical protein
METISEGYQEFDIDCPGITLRGLKKVCVGSRQLPLLY